MTQTPVAVVGAAGYSGVELLHILLEHPGVALAGLFTSDKGQPTAASPRISELHPRFRGLCDAPLRPTTTDAVAATGAKAVFLCTPHQASHDMAPALLDRGLVVFDLSAAFRFRDAAVYPRHYGFEHQRPDLLNAAVYGLPEQHRERIRSAQLVGVPGCYPTSAILALSPLVKAGALALGRRVVVDSISGVSGAGRSPQLRTLFCEVSVQPYEVLKHRHTPEIEVYAGAPVHFTPQVGPYERGIVSTIHADLRPGWTLDRIASAYSAACASEPFIRLLPRDVWPSVNGVRLSNFCDIGFAVHEESRHLVVVSAIDNLIKGAAGQAVQCFNLRFGYPETTALVPASKGNSS